MSTSISESLPRLLSEMIQINSVAPPGNERDLARFIASILRENGLNPVIQDLGGNRANLFCEIGNGDESRLILNGHLDTVPAEGEWKNDPFEGNTDGRYLYGTSVLFLWNNEASLNSSLDIVAKIFSVLTRGGTAPVFLPLRVFEPLFPEERFLLPFQTEHKGIRRFYG